MQTDEDEIKMVEIARKLKRVFGNDLKILFFSNNEELSEDICNIVDKFLDIPVDFNQVESSIQKLYNSGRKILLIDDSKLVHNHITPSLEKEGYELHHAYNGREGLDMAIQLKPDLVISDIEMPEMNGFEVCTGIRNQKEISETYIIMSSTLGSSSDIQKGFRAGVDEYITKPVNIGELIDRIYKVFHHSLMGRENILLIETDKNLASIISKSLKKQGFSSRTVESISAALNQIEKYTYDMILSETEFGQETAIDLCIALKSIPQEKKPSIILMTSKDSKADVKMAMNMGVSTVISKPFAMDTMIASVERLLADKKVNSERAQLMKYLSKSSARIASRKALLSGNESLSTVEKAVASLFFTDIVGFTPRCERYTPKEIVAQLNNLFEMMTNVIHTNNGDIDKFMGDACMAYWENQDQIKAARLMVKTCLDIERELNKMNQDPSVFGNDPIHIRFGMHTGEMIFCDIGNSKSRIDFTLIGDNVNLASRLESSSKYYGINKLVSENTFFLIKDDFIFREIDTVRVVGKDRSVRIYELFFGNDGANPKILELKILFEEALKQYKEQNFVTAKELFKKSSVYEPMYAANKISPSHIYYSRCDKFIKNPPLPNWDGVYNITKK